MDRKNLFYQCHTHKHVNPCKTGVYKDLGWALLDLNQGPLACEASALNR